MKSRAGLAVREIRKLRIALSTAHRSLARLSRHIAATAANPGGNGHVRPRLSTKACASLVLQGCYMSYMRQLKPRQKAPVRKIREAKGVRVAISQAKRLASS